ncbi:hypothetical protein [Streptomyces sp. NPDC005865]|uniref:hypothetical protein n=1 Tax=Streptomyces sp. NPDC005865 TaxID=3155453 RepID=UPI0033C2F1C4
MTRYGLAIKALPKGAKPFGDDEEQDQDIPDAETTEADAPPVAPDANAAAATPAKEAEDVNPLPVEESATEEVPDETVPPSSDPAAPSQDAGATPVAEPEDDARPWSGDMYDEGDETEPANAFAAYEGADGEEAWLDQAPDGTLTGWVRDATGQVWRYTDPDVWAIDVDDAQMTRTHSQASSSGADGTVDAERGGQDPLFPPKQS